MLMISLHYGLAAGAIVTCMLVPLAARMGKRMGAISEPARPGKSQAAAVSHSGGLAVLVGLLVGVAVGRYLVGGGPWPWIGTFLTSTALLVMVGFCDDVLKVRPCQKLTGQLIACVPVLVGQFHVDQIAWGNHEVALGWLAQPVTLLWLILGANALNLLDGIDGLASLIGILTAGTLAAMAAFSGQASAAVPAAVLVGALLGFLVYNLPPARVYLGECGSGTIGWILAFLILQVATDNEGTWDASTGFLLLLVPLLDTSLAIVRRTLRGQWFWRADREHLHHALLAQQFTKLQTLVILGALCAVSLGLAWIQFRVQAWWPWAVMFLVLSVAARRRLLAFREWGLIRATCRGLLTRMYPQPVQPASPHTENSGAAPSTELIQSSDADEVIESTDETTEDVSQKIRRAA